MEKNKPTFKRIIGTNSQKKLMQLGSVEELTNIIQKEVYPLKIEAENYDQLYETVLALKKIVGKVCIDKFFVSKKAELICALTMMDTHNRNRVIGLKDEYYEDELLADKWYKNILKQIHPDNNLDIQPEAMEAMNEISQIYSRIKDCFEVDE